MPLPRQDWISLATFTLKVILLTCLLGLAVDVITANVAVEYFTVHHPKVVESTSPWVMALIWGVGASWWFGLIAALVIWWVNSRRKQPLCNERVFGLIRRALASIWVAMMAILAGVYALASVVPAEKRRPSFESDRRLMSVAIAHSTEYVLGGLALLVICIYIARFRTAQGSD